MGIAAAPAVMAGVQMFSAFNQAEAGKQQSEFELAQLGTNARLADLDADEILRRGQEDVRQLNRRRADIRGEQRVQVAAQGIDLNSGSVQAVMDDTDAMAAADERTFVNNTWRAAFGKRMEANQYRQAAAFGRRNAMNNYQNTLLSGGLNAAGTIIGKGK